MQANKQPPRKVTTTTITPALKLARRELRIQAILVLLLGFWLILGLLNCSIDPELTTIFKHPFGSKTHTIAATLLYSFGLSSFLICSLFFTASRQLWTYQIPNIRLPDLSQYLIFISMTSTLFALTLPHLKPFGAPIGGVVGSVISHWLLSWGNLFSGVSLTTGIISILLLFQTQDLSLLKRSKEIRKKQKSKKEVKPVKSLLDSPTTPEVSQSVSLSNHYSRDYDEVQVDELDDSLAHALDDYLLPSEPIAPVQKRILEGAPHPRLTIAGEVNLSRNDLEPSLSGDYQLHSMSESNHPSITDSQNAQDLPSLKERLNRLAGSELVFNSSALSHSIEPPKPPSSLTQRTGPGVSGEKVIFSIPPSPVNANDQSDPLPSGRAGILSQALKSISLHHGKIKEIHGDVSDRYTLTLEGIGARPIHELALGLNDALRQLSTREYTPARLTLIDRNTNYALIEWPKPNSIFPSAPQAIDQIRHLTVKDPLSLYLGDLVTSGPALLPFQDVSSVLIGGGSNLDLHKGLDLIITNLIYQAPPTQIRFIVVDPAKEATPYQFVPHLYSPLLHDEVPILECLSWFSAEARRRHSQFSRHGIAQFDEYQSRSQEEIQRLVLIVPNFSSLNDEQKQQLSSCLERCERYTWDLGLHIIINTRAPLDLPRAVLDHIRASIILKTDDPREGLRLGVDGAEWLMEQHDMLLSLTDRIYRVHGWQLTQSSFFRVLKTFKEPPQYIAPDQVFIRTRKRETGSIDVAVDDLSPVDPPVSV